MMNIKIVAYDDTTYIDEEDWGMSFSKEEIEIIGKLADISKSKHSYVSEPYIEVEEEEEE